MNSDAELIYQFLSAPGPVPDRADVIIALGTYDLRVADYAAEVFLSGRAPLLICSGGLGKLTSSLFTTPEAELFAERCRSLGVPPENILIEAASTNTGENFRFSRDLLSERGIFPRTGIAVCKPYMPVTGRIRCRRHQHLAHGGRSSAAAGLCRKGLSGPRGGPG